MYIGNTVIHKVLLIRTKHVNSLLEVTFGGKVCFISGHLFGVWRTATCYEGLHMVGDYGEGYYSPTWVAA
jgi:hypothetical protein